MSGSSAAGNRSRWNIPYMAGWGPAANGSTCRVMFGVPAASGRRGRRGGGDPQQGEHPVQGGVGARRERQYLQGDVWRPGGLDEAGELAAHDGWAVGGGAEDPLGPYLPPLGAGRA